LLRQKKGVEVSRNNRGLEYVVTQDIVPIFRHNGSMRILAPILLISSFAVIQAAEPLPALYPGVKAPEVKVSAWVKYKEPKVKGHFRVVEFWATWCGPCRESIPHLTELAKKYQKKVDFIGVDVLEQGDDIPARVKKFVKSMGAKMDYPVAMDLTNTMAKKWLEASRQTGIPTAFLVDPKGYILFIGHPMEIEPYIKKAIAGKLDIKQAKKEYLGKIASMSENERERMQIDQAGKLWKAGDKKGANKLLEAIAVKSPEKAKAIKQMRLWTVYKSSDPECKALVEEYLNAGEEGWRNISIFAINQATQPEGDKELGKSLATQILEKSKEPETLYLVTIVFTQLGDFEKVLQAADKGLANTNDQTPANNVESLKQAKANAEAKLKK
jgi:thiol-disulfide isomerase/thioredoxin